MRFCLFPACGATVRSGYCPTHQRQPWASKAPRIRGRKLQRLRMQLFAQTPFCVLCLAKTPEVLTLATIRDHIIPLKEGGTDDEANTNVQALCQACSDAKTRRESLRGRLRSR